MSITIPGSVGGTSSVSLGILLSIRGHLGEVESTIGSAWQVGNIHIVSEFLIQKTELLVCLSVFLEKVDTRRREAAAWVEELKLEGVAAGGDTVAAIVDSFDGAVDSAVFGFGAGGRVEDAIVDARIVAYRD